MPVGFQPMREFHRVLGAEMLKIRESCALSGTRFSSFAGVLEGIQYDERVLRVSPRNVLLWTPTALLRASREAGRQCQCRFQEML